MIKFLGKLLELARPRTTTTGQLFHPAQICAECGSRLMRADGADEWRCPNLDCPKQIRARIRHWCSAQALDIAAADPQFIAALVGCGLARDVAELYRLRLAELTALPGRDPGSAQTIFADIEASRKREAWRVLFGLHIPHLTALEAQSVCRHFASVDNVFAASFERLRQAEHVSEAAARSLVQWHGDSVNRRLVRRLFKAGLNFRA